MSLSLKPNEIIRRPLLTEKSVHLQQASRTYTFECVPSANKTQIKEAIQALFKVKVSKVNTINYDGKPRRVGRFSGTRPAWKKAYVTLAEGQTLEGI